MLSASFTLETLAPGLTTLVGVVVVSVLGYLQWRKGQATQLLLEKAKHEMERERLSWERQKLALEQRFVVEQQQLASAQDERARAAAEEQERLSTAARATRRALALEQGVRTLRRSVIEDLGHVKILDMAKPIDLSSLYVQLRIREDGHRGYSRAEHIARDKEGDPSSLLVSQRDQQRESAAGATSPEEALARFRRIVVIGDPGAGKTTTLRYLAYRLARHERIGNLEVPVYVELRRFVDANAGSLLEFVETDWSRRYGFDAAATWLGAELNAGRAALLLDGLDEVLGGDDADAAQAAYDLVLDEVNALATRYPRAAIVVTCRRAAWEGGLHAFRSLEVLDFTWDQVEQFIARWFEGSPERGARLTRALDGNLRMQLLASNPLLLSLIAIVYERDLDLPERRAELYARCVDVLLREWDAHRGIERFTRFTADRKRDLLEEVAWHFHCAGRRYFPRDELLAVVRRFLPTISVDPSQSDAILEEIAQQYGLLKSQAPGWYGFLHLTFQEYFAAIAALGHQDAGLGMITRHVGASWWEEVTILLAGRMADASPLLLTILNSDQAVALASEDAPLADGDDLFCTRLFLAGRCLVGTPKIRLNGLRDRITQDLAALLRSRWELDRDRAALTLVEIGDPRIGRDLRRRLMDDSELEEVRVSIARALGKGGEASAAQALVRLVLSGPNLSDALRVAMIRAVADAQALEARPYLRDLLKRAATRSGEISGTAETTDLLASEAAAALARMHDREAAPLMIDAVRAIVTEGDELISYAAERVFEACGTALQVLGSADVADELFGLANSAHSYPFAAGSLYRAAVRIGGERVGRQLVARLSESDADPLLWFALSDGVEEIHAAYAVSSMLDAAGDERLPWQRRWLIVGHLERFPHQAQERAVRMVKQTDLALHVRTALAAVLTVWGEDWLQPDLRQALSTLPPRVVIGSGPVTASRGGTWARVTSALAGIGDDSYVPFLMDQVEIALDSPDHRTRSSAPAETLNAVAEACETARPLVVARAILDAAGSDPEIAAAGRWMELLASTLSSTGAASVAAYVRSVGPPAFSGRSAGRVLHEIATRADTSVCITHLTALLTAFIDEADPRRTWASDACYEALHRLSQRLAVTIDPVPAIENGRGRLLI